MLKLLLGFFAGWLLRPFVSVRRRFGKVQVAVDKRRLKAAKTRAKRFSRGKGGRLFIVLPRKAKQEGKASGKTKRNQRQQEKKPDKKHKRGV
ncbi:MAG: hypothetical protein IJF59_02085 [Clostridia bacterium]|nr:hypothetical protein [Clostridia bacterium]MBQ3077792.1 hypothetical protein [Clostridia bacterium]